MKTPGKKTTFFYRFWLLITVLGPGLITASADNDAPGIATYSMAGSRYGYKFLWLLVVVTFGEVIVQEMAARLGAVTGKGTADLIREKFGVKTTFFAMVGLLIANLGTTFAQFAGIAAGAELLGVSRYIIVPITAVVIAVLVLRGSYKRVETVLLILCLSALSYVISAVVLKPDWIAIAKSAVVPVFEMNSDYILAVLATIGTTITPWGIFYMQASVVDKGVSIDKYDLTRMDVIFGAVWGNVISAFIIITTGATLFKQGIFVEEAEQAAMALAPLAGNWAKLLFTTGLIGASILAALVLPLSTVYPITEAFGWERGLNHSRKEAPIFYGLFITVILISAIVVLIPGLPLFRLMWISQSVNAILLPVLLILLLKLVNDKNIMSNYVNKKWQNYFLYGLIALISATTVMFMLQPFIT
jgi:NRAMP (natural resistance-associated macrophage protein)-like metal ion transporter